MVENGERLYVVYYVQCEILQIFYCLQLYWASSWIRECAPFPAGAVCLQTPLQAHCSSPVMVPTTLNPDWLRQCLCVHLSTKSG